MLLGVFMKKYLIFSLLLIASQMSLTSNDLSFGGEQYSASVLSKAYYNKILNTNFNKNYVFLYSAIKCYENMDKTEIALSDEAKKELELILADSISKDWFAPSWSSVRLKCKAFCLRYGGYLLSDEESIKEDIQQIKKENRKWKS